MPKKKAKKKPRKRAKTTYTYQEKYHGLLIEEQKAQEKLLQEKCNGFFTLDILVDQHSENKHQLGYLSNDKLNSELISYIKRSTVEVMIQLVDSEITLKAITVDEEHLSRHTCIVQNKLLVSFAEIEYIKKPEKSSFDTNVTFVNEPYFYCRLHKALDSLSPEIVKMLDAGIKQFSYHRCNSSRISRKFPKLDKHQTKCLEVCLSALDPISPILITGLFGTGKTRLLARATCEVLLQDVKTHVLICTYHDSAADSFIVDYFGKTCLKYVRFHSVKSYSAPTGYEAFYTSDASNLDKQRLVITTFSSSFDLLDQYCKGIFTHIILDDCAQTIEPETIIPLCLANKNTKIIMAGDIKQVGLKILSTKQEKLKISLIERLLNFVPDLNCITLFINYRCHHNLATLPSNLFYNSSINTANEIDANMHSLTEYPFYFICSSISEEVTVKDEDSFNETEAKLLLDAVLEYVKECSDKQCDLSKLCIVVVTLIQKSAVEKLLESKDYAFSLSKNLKVLTVYDIHGYEFDAIFVSTVEPIDDSKPNNPNQSLCNQDIFHKVLTCVRYRVVCAGNPFILIKSEEQMSNNEGSCWIEYIKRCITYKTFKVSLLKDDKDSIIPLFSKLWPSLHSLNLHCPKPKKVTYFSEHDAKCIKCQLNIINYRYAEATPILQKSNFAKPIKIIGRKNRKTAFNGDIVLIHVFRNTHKKSENVYGKVIQVIESLHPTKFVCRLYRVDDKHKSFFFSPLDKTVPIITNLELPKDHVSYKKSNDDVIVFEQSSLTSEPKIVKEFVPRKLSHNLFFIVEFIRWEFGKWSPEHENPLGAVIEVLPQTSDLFFTERLLNITKFHTVNDDDNAHYDFDDNDQSSNDVPQFDDAAFTIDRLNTINLDDALSIQTLIKDKKYKIAVFIANVAKFITKGDDLDALAMRKGTTAYGGGRPKHMLPVNLTSRYSLNYKQRREVLCITGLISMNNGEVVEVSCDVDDFGPVKAQVTSQARLTYQSAQGILDGSYDNLTNDEVTIINENWFHDNNDDIQTKLRNFYKIAKWLHKERLGGRANDDGDNDDAVEAPESHLIVSELMIWANSRIAKYLHDNLNDLALLYRQLSPEHQHIQSFREGFQEFLSYSLSLNLQLNQDNQGMPLIVPNSLLTKLHNFHGSGDYKSLLHALTNDLLYPQLAQAMLALRFISNSGEYLPANNEDGSRTELLRHHGLNVDFYTHFTSPIRRYFDILVQRLTIALMGGDDISYTLEELQIICFQLNYKTKLAKKFEKAMGQVVLARECETNLIKEEAFIIKPFPSPKEYEYFLHLPSNNFKHLSGRDLKFDISHLNVSKYENENEIIWHVVMSDLKFNDNFNNFSDLRFTHANASTSIDSLSSNNISLNLPNSDLYCMKVETFEEVIKNGQKYLKHTNHHGTFPVDVHKVDATVWGKVHKCKLSFDPLNPNYDSLDKLMRHIPNPKEQSSSLKFFNSFSRDSFIICTVKRPLKYGEIVNVWLGKSIIHPTPIPSICLMEIAPSISICVQHMQNPADCFCNEKLENTFIKANRSLKDYKKMWIKSVLSEAAYVSVTDGSKTLFILKNAVLKWPEIIPINNGIDVLHYSLVKDGEITLTIPYEKAELLNFINIGKSDLICARYNITSNDEAIGGVYHFYVTNSDNGNEDKKDTTVTMKCMGSCLISEKVKPYINGPCDIQIIKMPVSYRRVFKRLQEIDEINLQFLFELTSFRNSQQPDIETVRFMRDDPYAIHLWDNPTIALNRMQMNAIELSLRNSFQLIQGPPGTGKSVVGAHLVYIFSKLINKSTDKCVLYCCPSNKAVDVVHKKLKDLNAKLTKCSLDGLKILRLYGRAHEYIDYPNPCDYLKNPFIQIEGRCLAEFKEDALHYLIRMNNPDIQDKERNFAELVDEGLLPNLSQKQEYLKLIREAETGELSKKYDVILCTCNETCSARLKKHEGIGQCIVDECGMAHEPETIAAASLCDHVVLIGDHKQLQPVVKHYFSRKYGLQRSLFERYAFYRQELLIKLNVQYRMHPTICQAPSELFYEGILQTDDSVNMRQAVIDRSFWKGRNSHVILHDVVEETPSTHHYTNINSISNETEVSEVIKKVQELVNVWNVPIKSIAVLTPYAAQKDLLNKKMSEVDLQPKVATIIESQGDEYDIVILTTVRSLPLEEIEHEEFVEADFKWKTENLGFLIDNHQLNVAITRAKEALIIVGNLTLLKYHDKWKEMIKIVQSQS
jgi:superfamily I DNA and/or RNA helicase/exoribonuclease R